MRAVPEGWIQVRIGDVAHINPPRSKPDYEDSTPLVFVPMPRVAEEFGGIDVSERRPFSSIKRGYTQFRPGDVLFAKITPCMENGKIAIVPEIRPPLGYGSTEFFVMRPRAHGLSRWIAHCVAQSRFRDLARKNMQGAVGQRRVPKVWVKDASVPLAPLPEQRRIVAKIESLFAKLDEGVTALKRAEANLERYRASVLKSAVEGRLTEQWRRENPPEETGEQLLGRILAERRKCWEEEQLAKFAAKGRKPPGNWKAKYKEPVAPDTGTLPELPDGWCWVTVDQVAPVIQYGHTASADPSKQDGPRFLRITDIQGGRVQWSAVPGCAASEAETKKYRLNEGDIVFARTGATTGKSYLIENHPEAIFASYLIRVGLSTLVRSRYVSVFFQSGAYWAQIERGKRGIGQPNVNARVLAHITLPLPPSCEQVAIANRVVSGENAVRQTSGHFLKSCLSRASCLRQSILKSAFEGRLVPQDPADEPAAVLLDRIRAERAAERNRRKRRPSQRKRQPKTQIA